MNSPSWKPFLAALMMVLIYMGVWVVAHFANYIIFRDLGSVVRFIFITLVIWNIPIFAGPIRGSKFTFQDHGHQLSIIALVSTLAILYSPANDYEMKSVNSYALPLMFVLFLMTLYINSHKSAQDGRLHWTWRAVNMLIGTFAAQAYIAIAIEEEVERWALS